MSSGAGSSNGSLSNPRPSKVSKVGGVGVAQFNTKAPKTMTLINSRIQPKVKSSTYKAP